MKAELDSKGHLADLVDQFLRLFREFESESSNDFGLIQSQRILGVGHLFVQIVTDDRTSRTGPRLNGPDENGKSGDEDQGLRRSMLVVSVIVPECPTRSCTRNRPWFQPEVHDVQ